MTSNEVGWAQFVCSAAAGLAATAAVTRTDALFAGALCWALSGIHANQVRLELPPLAAQASLVAAAVAGAAVAGAAASRIWLYATGRLLLAPSSLTLGGGSGGEGGGADAGKAAAPAVVVENVLVGAGPGAGAVEWARTSARS